MGLLPSFLSFLGMEVAAAAEEEEDPPRGGQRQLNCRRPHRGGGKGRENFFCEKVHLLLFPWKEGKGGQNKREKVVKDFFLLPPNVDIGFPGIEDLLPSCLSAPS